MIFLPGAGREEAQCVCWPGAEMAFQRHSPSTESSQDPSPCKLRDCWSGGKSRSVGRTSQLLGMEEKLEALRSLGQLFFVLVCLSFFFSISIFGEGEGISLSFRQMYFPAGEHLSKLYLVWKAHPKPSADCREKHHCQYLNYKGSPTTACIEFTTFNYNTPQWNFHRTFYPCVKSN